MFEATGSIDIVPSLAWSEVKAAGFMVADSNGVPKTPPGQWVALTGQELVLDRPEGALHKYNFDHLVAAEVEVPLDQRELMRAQVAAIVAAFPNSVFGGASRNIRFRGNELDDIWRIRVNPDRTVVRQVADLQWTTPLQAGKRLLGTTTLDDAIAASMEPVLPPNHCGELADHAPHAFGTGVCVGGPMAAPGATLLKATDG